jgi:hypothetical protein
VRRFLAIAVLLTIAAAIGIARRTQPMAPTGDTAVIESYTLLASQGRLLVGPYSRFQWHHPGPIYFYVLAPFYAAAGQRTSGLNAAALAINVTALALAVTIAATSGGAIFAAALAAASALYVSRVGDLVTSAWNPHIVVLPTMAAAIACAAAAGGRRRMLPLAALVASAVAQTDVGVLPVAVLLGGASLVSMSIAGSRDRSSRRRFWPAAGATVLVLAVAWLLPIVEQVTDAPGNLAALWSFFARGAGAGQPLPVAFAAWSDMLSWIVRPDFHLAHGLALRRSHGAWAQAWAIGQMAVLALSVAVSFRAGRRFELWVSTFLLAASLAALWSITRIDGDIMDHEIFWVSGLGVLNTAAAADQAARALGLREEMVPAAAAMVLCGLLVAVCATLGLRGLSDIRARALVPGRETIAIQRTARAVADYLRGQGVERPLVRIDQATWAVAAGVLLQLQKADVPYAVDDDWLPMFTEAARATGRERIVLSIAGAARHFLMRSQPGTFVVAGSDAVFVDAIPAGH